MKTKFLDAVFVVAAIGMFAFGCNQPQQTTGSDEAESTTTSALSDGFDRSILPIRETYYPAQTELDARNAKAPARFEVTAPEKAPNVVIVLIDDIGFGHSSAFGGPINMPTLENLLQMV